MCECLEYEDGEMHLCVVCADEWRSLRLALETATREAEEERRTAEAAVKFLGRIGEVTWDAGLPSGDREQTLKNVRALASRPAPPADAATEAVREARDAKRYDFRDVGLGYQADWCPVEDENGDWVRAEVLVDLLAALSPAPAPSAPAMRRCGQP